jgi:hypothetical protein
MKPSFANELSASFVLFLDHELCKRAEAFQNIYSGQLFPSSDSSFPNNTVYQSNFKQWVVDSSIVSLGALEASGIFNSGNFIAKGQNGLNIDYGNGRVFLSGSFPKNSNAVFANFAAKEFNIYLTSKDESEIFLDSSSEGGLKNRAEKYPLIYVKNFYGTNSPFAFGGTDESSYEYRCTILSDSSFKLDSALSVLQDCSKKSFRKFSSSEIPFNIFGDFKSGISGFNYENFCDFSDENVVFVDSVKISKFDERVNKLIKEDVWGGFADFSLKSIRNPRFY